MKVLVAVASKHGATRELAAVIADELGAAGHAVDLLEAGAVGSLAGYGAAVLGSALYMGAWLPEARRLVERHRAELAALPLWLFSSGPLGEEAPQPEPDAAALLAPFAGLRVRGHEVFAGRLDRARLGVGEKLVARLVKAPDGDFRDLAAVRTWASTIAADLAA